MNLDIKETREEYKERLNKYYVALGTQIFKNEKAYNDSCKSLEIDEKKLENNRLIYKTSEEMLLTLRDLLNAEIYRTKPKILIK